MSKTNSKRYYLILKNRKTKLFDATFLFESKKEFRENLGRFYPKFPVTKFEYIYGVALLTAVKTRKKKNTANAV